MAIIQALSNPNTVHKIIEAKSFLRVFLTLILSLSIFYSFGQQAPGIAGRVVDSVSRKPLDFITVSVFGESGAVIASGYTNADGGYKLALKSAGRLRIRYSFVGYADKETSLDFAAKNEVVLKDVYLSPNTKNLDEVTITANKKLVIQKPGMLIYNAGNDPSNKGGTATDVLRKAPVLSVDARGNVSMRGSSNIKILVDGKYSGQMARSPADALNMMPADIIESVEVVTTPSAKYDAEGAAGVINIITKKGRKQVSGSLEAVASNWEQVLNPRFSLANKKWNINTNAHLHRLRSKSVNDNQRINRNNGAAGSVLDQHIVEENVAPHGSASITADYTVDSLNQFSFGITSWFGNWPENSLMNNTVTLPDGTVSERYNQRVDTKAGYLGADFNIGYTHKFKKPGREITLLVQMSPSKDNSRYFSDQTSPQNALLYREINNNNTRNREWTFQADYLHPFGKENRYSFEGGAKMISRSVSSNYVVSGSADDAQPDVLAPIPDRTDIFDYSQRVLAGYMIFKFNLPGNWYAEAGSRVEGTFLEGNFISAGNSFSTDFVNFVPTATISKKITELQNISLSYTKRLTRPYIWDLNPNVNSSDPKNLSVGNPQLQPEMAHQAELSYGISLNSGLSLNPAIFWKQTNNSIEYFTTVNSEGISTTSTQNLAANRQYGLNLSATIPLNAKWSLNGNANVNRLNFNSAALQITSKGWGAEFNLNTNYKLPHNLTLQAFGAYNTRAVTLQGYETSTYYYSFAAKKEITSQKITVTLATINPFTRFIKQTEAIRNTSFYANNLSREYNQAIKLTVGWEFGKLFKQQESKKVQNDDVKNNQKG